MRFIDYKLYKQRHYVIIMEMIKIPKIEFSRMREELEEWLNKIISLYEVNL